MATAEQKAQYKQNAINTANKIGTSLDNVVANRPASPTAPINNAGQSSSTATSMGAPKITPPPTGAQNVQINKPSVPVTPTATAGQIPNLNSNQTNYVNRNFGSTNNYVKSQVDRYQNAAQSGDRDLYNRVQADANRLGYQLPNVALNQNGIRSTDPNTGLPTWIGANVNQEIQAQIDALMGQQAAAQQAAQFGVNQNQQYLQQQLAGLAAQQAVDNQGAQDLQNRRGGFYSGGLDYQLGSIGSAYANQRGQLNREIASRNQQLLDQYGTQANTLAQQIAGLQSNRPQLVNEAINNYLNNQATLTGNYLGQRTLAGQTQDYNQFAEDRQFNWDTNPNNPYYQGQVLQNQGATIQNQGRVIQNQIDQLKLQNLPAEIKANLQILEQQVKSGQISNQAAAYELEQLINPNSIANQIQRLELQGKQVSLNNSINRSAGGSSGGGRSSGGSGGSSNSGGTKASASELNSIEKSLQSQYGARDPKGVYKPPTNPASQVRLIDAILDLNLSDDQTEGMLRRFGIAVDNVEEIYDKATTRYTGDLK